MTTPPTASGVRLPWAQLPARILRALEDRLGAPVASATMQAGGFSPGVAARVVGTMGQRVFVKAVGPELNSRSPGIFRLEARIAAGLQPAAELPRLLWTYDEEESEGGWVMLAFEDIDGRNPAQPWRPNELERVMDAHLSLQAKCTPSPIEVPSAGVYFARGIHGWQRLWDEPLDGLDAWSVRHLRALAALESGAVDAVGGNTLLHLDIRADNIILAPDRVVFVDWPNASTGAAWVDVVGFAPSVVMQEGPGPEDLLMQHPGAQEADPNAISSVVAALAGYFTRGALLPPPPGLPTIRAFQAAQGVEARRWLAQRMGWK